MRTTKLTRATILFLVVFAIVLSIGVVQYLQTRSRLGDPPPMSMAKTLACVTSLSISRQLQTKTQDFTLLDFVGTYYHTGFDSGVLTINADNGFSLEWLWDFGTLTAYTGTVAYVKKETVPNGNRLPGDRLIPVKWGQRRYLVFSNQLDFFCEWMTNGWEPRNENQIFLFHGRRKRIQQAFCHGEWFCRIFSFVGSARTLWILYPGSGKNGNARAAQPTII